MDDKDLENIKELFEFTDLREDKKQFTPTIKIEDKFTYVNLGDWINHNTYAVFEKDKIVLQEFISQNKSAFITLFHAQMKSHINFSLLSS